MKFRHIAGFDTEALVGLVVAVSVVSTAVIAWSGV